MHRTNIEIDDETARKLGQLGVKISPTCRDFLNSLVAAYFENKDAGQLLEINNELKKIRDNITDLAIKENKLLQQKEAIMHKVESEKKQTNKEVLNTVKGIKASGMLAELG